MLGPALAALWFFGTRRSFSDAPNEEDVFLVATAWFSSALWWSAAMTALAVAWASARFSTSWAPSFVGAVTGLLVTATTLIGGSIVHGTDPRIVEERESSDGRRFAVFRVSGMDLVELFAPQVSRGPVRASYRALIGHGDEPPKTGSLVRPASQVRDGRRIYFGPTDLVAVSASDGRCWAAASRAGERFVVQDVQRLSPFALLGDRDVGWTADVDRIVADVSSPDAKSKTAAERYWLAHPSAPVPWPPALDQGRDGVPTDESLLAALDHANPWVRDAARRIVEAGGPVMYPEATRRIALTEK